MNNEILDSLRRISCGMEIVMRDVIEKEELKVNWERIMNDIKKDYLED